MEFVDHANSHPEAINRQRTEVKSIIIASKFTVHLTLL